ncbi:MAG TPA: glycosyltransferase family 39 protein [Terriglobales bacterium]|nr:glycosyltransferase family 39 protein [Terriglobales bacterium]
MNLPVALRDNQPDPPAHVSGSAPDSTLTSSRSIWILILLWLLIYVTAIFHPPLMDDADTVHAEAAREMLLRHDGVTLYTDGIRYLEKAPLMYWSLAASYSVFGISDWSTRVPLALGVLGVILATYGLGRYAFGERAGLWAGVVVSTSVGPYVFTRFLIPDILVGLWLTLGYYFFLRSLEEDPPSRWTCGGFAATCALNVMTKGLIGLVFPAVAIGLYLILTGNLRHLAKLRIGFSTVIFFVIAAPWHILAALHNPAQGEVRGFLWFYFVNEHLNRFLNKRVPPGYDTVPLLIFWILVLVWMIPWVAFLPESLRGLPLRRRHARPPLDRQQRAHLLFFLWPLAILGFFSFSTRQEYYTVPGLPGIALLLGAWLARESSPDALEDDLRAGRISSAVMFAIGVVAFLVGASLLLLSRPPTPGMDLADLLKKNPQDYDFSLGHVLDLTPGALGFFRIPLLGTSLSLLLGTFANWILRRKRNPAFGNLALALMMVGVLASVHSAFVGFSPILSSRGLAAAVQRYYQPGDIVVVDGEYHKASTLNFYLRVPLHVLHEPSGNLWYGSKFPDAPHIFETPASFGPLWAGQARVFLWADQESPAVLEGRSRYRVAQSGGKFIFTNQALPPPH